MLFQTDVLSCNPTIVPATNKLVGYTFDNAGNTKVDATGQIFTYDAENKQILVKEANGNTIGEYFYDGDGKRVKKIANNEETIFVYNASGQLIADYATQISQTPKVSYLTSDHLGSPRITTDADGDIYTRRDFMPFGEEIDSSHTSQRTATLNYASDEIRQKFTSYERDEETELDFAQARMHNYNLGRFNSPDPLLSSGREALPQSWNRYVYVLNNPLVFIDPSGLYEWAATARGSSSDKELEARKKHKDKKKRNFAKRALNFRESFRAALDRAREALDSKNITADQKKQIKESLSVYGKENEDTDVAVGVSIKKYPKGQKASVLLEDDDTVRITFVEGHKGDKLAVTIAHEGRHAADALAWVKARHPKGGGLDLNQHARETRGWTVSSYMGQAFNLGNVSASGRIKGKSSKVWSKGWKEADRATKRSRGINNILNYMKLKPTDTDTYSNSNHNPKHLSN